MGRALRSPRGRWNCSRGPHPCRVACIIVLDIARPAQEVFHMSGAPGQSDPRKSFTMDRDVFRSLVSALTVQVADGPLDAALEQRLNGRYPAGSTAYEAIFAACRAATAAGWMCSREAGGVRFGRVIKPGPETHGFSVDVADMSDCRGPHHVHPNGEIDLIMPLEG